MKRVRTSPTDTKPGFLIDKIVAGDSTAVTEITNGDGSKSLSISGLGDSYLPLGATLNDLASPDSAFDMNNQDLKNIKNIYANAYGIGIMENLYPSSDIFHSAGWYDVVNTTSGTNNSQTGIDGFANTATNISGDSVFRRNLGLVAGQIYTVSLIIKNISGNNNFGIALGETSPIPVQTLIPTDNTFRKYQVQITCGSGDWIDFIFNSNEFHIQKLQIWLGTEQRIPTDTTADITPKRLGGNLPFVNLKVVNLQAYTNSSPIEGDLWFDGTALNFRVAGVTKTVNLT